MTKVKFFCSSSLALLWFHTIVRPFFGLDGSNLKSGSDAAQRLIDSSRPEFQDSALFLFFQGRVDRLKVRVKLLLHFLRSLLLLRLRLRLRLHLRLQSSFFSIPYVKARQSERIEYYGVVESGAKSIAVELPHPLSSAVGRVIYGFPLSENIPHISAVEFRLCCTSSSGICQPQFCKYERISLVWG